MKGGLMAERPDNAKKSVSPPRKFTNRKSCVERAIERAKLRNDTAAVWRELLSGFVTYTNGCPVDALVERFEMVARATVPEKVGRDWRQVPNPDSYNVWCRSLREHTGGIATFVRAHLTVLSIEGLVRLGVARRTNNSPVEEPWVWPLPVEAWPDEHFLAALALRLDP
jgi:hypothetical protein